jgi:hypothetical protein
MYMYYVVSLHSNTSQNVGFLAHNKVSCFCSVPNLFFVIYAFLMIYLALSCFVPVLFLSYSCTISIHFLTCPLSVSRHVLIPNSPLLPLSSPVTLLFLSFSCPFCPDTLMSLSSSSVLLLFLSCSHVSPLPGFF